MNKVLLVLSVFLSTFAGASEVTSLKESDAQIDSALISDVKELDAIYSPRGGTLYVRLVTLRIEGNHRDVSPSFRHYLTFHRVSESSVRRSVFLLGDSWGVMSVKKSSIGNYALVLKQLTDQVTTQTMSVNIDSLFRDNRNTPTVEFEDRYLDSRISVD